MKVNPLYGIFSWIQRIGYERSRDGDWVTGVKIRRKFFFVKSNCCKPAVRSNMTGMSYSAADWNRSLEGLFMAGRRPEASMRIHLRGKNVRIHTNKPFGAVQKSMTMMMLAEPFGFAQGRLRRSELLKRRLAPFHPEPAQRDQDSGCGSIRLFGQPRDSGRTVYFISKMP